MELPVKASSGEVVDRIQVSDGVFGVPVNMAVVFQAMLVQRANARQGNAKTKNRSEVSGGGIKPRPQKHSGRSRQGSIRAPQWPGGGRAFGPRPRDYRQAIPKKMRRLAIRCLLSDRAAEGKLTVLQGFGLSAPSTKAMKGILGALQIDASALLVTRDSDKAVYQSARNLPRVKVLPASILNVLDLLNHQHLIMTVDAVRRAEELWAREGRGKAKAQALEPGEAHAPAGQ